MGNGPSNSAWSGLSSLGNRVLKYNQQKNYRMDTTSVGSTDIAEVTNGSITISLPRKPRRRTWGLGAGRRRWEKGWVVAVEISSQLNKIPNTPTPDAHPVFTLHLSPTPGTPVQAFISCLYWKEGKQKGTLPPVPLSFKMRSERECLSCVLLLYGKRTNMIGVFYYRFGPLLGNIV